MSRRINPDQKAKSDLSKIDDEGEALAKLKAVSYKTASDTEDYLKLKKGTNYKNAIVDIIQERVRRNRPVSTADIEAMLDFGSSAVTNEEIIAGVIERVNNSAKSLDFGEQEKRTLISKFILDLELTKEQSIRMLAQTQSIPPEDIAQLFASSGGINQETAIAIGKARSDLSFQNILGLINGHVVADEKAIFKEIAEYRTNDQTGLKKLTGNMQVYEAFEYLADSRCDLKAAGNIMKTVTSDEAILKSSYAQFLLRKRISTDKPSEKFLQYKELAENFDLSKSDQAFLASVATLRSNPLMSETDVMFVLNATILSIQQKAQILAESGIPLDKIKNLPSSILISEYAKYMGEEGILDKLAELPEHKKWETLSMVITCISEDEPLKKSLSEHALSNYQDIQFYEFVALKKNATNKNIDDENKGEYLKEYIQNKKSLNEEEIRLIYSVLPPTSDRTHDSEKREAILAMADLVGAKANGGILERFASRLNKTLSGNDFNKTRTEKLARLGYNIHKSTPVVTIPKKTEQAHAAIRAPVEKNLAQAEISRSSFRSKIEQQARSVQHTTTKTR